MNNKQAIDDLIRAVGRIAYNAGLPLTGNPYKSEETRALWEQGWRAAEKEAKEATNENP